MKTLTALETPAFIEIPRRINFIWAGGDKLVPDSLIEDIVKWALENLIS